MNLNNTKLFSSWLGYKLPKVHYQIKRNGNTLEITKYIFRNYLIHPLKRRVAKYYIFVLQKYFNLKVIGITGSAGKTTTKEMLKSILSKDGETIASFENIDPVFNIPTTILKCSPKTKYLILEMGVEYPNEMDFYLWLAKPDIGIITNIYPTHLLYFGNEEGVLSEKRKLAEDISEKGNMILNRDNKYLKRLGKNVKAKITWFGKGQRVCVKNILYTKDFKTIFSLILEKNEKLTNLSIKLPILGKSYTENAAAAAAVAMELGIANDFIKRGLEYFEIPKHRMRVVIKSNNVKFFDDTYNSNPQALESSLDTYFKLSKPQSSILIIGDMLELGEYEKKYHEALAFNLIKNIKRIKKIYLIGTAVKITFNILCKNINAERLGLYPVWSEAIDDIKKNISFGDDVFIKGSRSINLDKLVSRL